jgi:sialic acid synthase SpsE
MDIARKSLHLKADLENNHVLKAEDLIALRPGDGISPMLIDSILGKKLVLNLPKGHKIQMNDLA